MQAGASLHIAALPQMTPFTQHKWEGGGHVPFSRFFWGGQGIARYEIRDALPFAMRVNEKRDLSLFPNHVQMLIASVPATISAKPVPDFGVRRSPNTIQAKAMETRMESLSICTTTLT